jgi:hypothetical protein
MQIAVVATARKLAVLCWHMITRGEDYAFARPSLTAKKLRALELKAGKPSRRGRKGTAAGYSLKEVRRRERELAGQAERGYRQPGRRRSDSRRLVWKRPLGFCVGARSRRAVCFGPTAQRSTTLATECRPSIPRPGTWSPAHCSRPSARPAS